MADEEHEHGLGDAPIEYSCRAMMTEFAALADQIFNGDERPRRVGFVLMAFPFAERRGSLQLHLQRLARRRGCAAEGAASPIRGNAGSGREGIMTDEQKAAFIMAQATCAMATIAGMQAENRQRLANGYSITYDETAFENVANRYGIHHNAVITFFGG